MKMTRDIAATPNESFPDAAPVTGRVLITGATGFVGGYLRVAISDLPLRLLVRDPAKYTQLASDRVELTVGDITQPETLRGVMDGCEAVVNLVGIIEERGEASFEKIIHHGAANVVAEARKSGISRLIHMSALGAAPNPEYGYLNAKWRAEEAVRASGIPWTIFRPSVIFGPGDGFITVLARLIKRAPVIPVVGDGASKFQPVSAPEVAAAFARALADPATAGQIYELGGGAIYTYEEMLDVIAAELGKRKRKIHLPVKLMMPVVKLSAPLPQALRPPVTTEQLKMLALDNCTGRSATAELIGHQPTKLEDAITYVRTA